MAKVRIAQINRNVKVVGKAGVADFHFTDTGGYGDTEDDCDELVGAIVDSGLSVNKWNIWQRKGGKSVIHTKDLSPVAFKRAIKGAHLSLVCRISKFPQPVLIIDDVPYTGERASENRIGK